MRILNAVEHCPVGENTVKEVVGHAQEAVNVDLKVSADGHVRQLCFKPAQLGLKMRHRILGVIEMAVLHEIRKEAAAHQIPGTPALGAV